MSETRVWLYARAQDQESVDFQFTSLEQYAMENGLSVQGRSQDLCFGTSLDRPGLQEGKRAIEGGQARVLLVVKFSRLCRDIQSMLSFLREIKAFGGKVLSTTEGEPNTTILEVLACTPESEMGCAACGDNVNANSDGCTVGELICNGEVYDRVKVGDEADIYTDLNEDQRCSGCFARIGYFHHFGCGFERCPACGNPMSECECEDIAPPEAENE